MLEKFLSKHQKRIVGLDILRSIAILIVVYVHGRVFLPKASYKFYAKLQVVKLDGVSIFFVLSGFLIGRILLKTIANTSFTFKDLRNFWIRRWFRTLPNYFLVLFVLVAARRIYVGDFGAFNFHFLTFTQNFKSIHPQFFPEAWSLSIEEWFYLLFPIVCFFLVKLLNKKTLAVLISAVLFLIVPFVLRVIKWEAGIDISNFDEAYRKIVIYRLDSIMYGVLGAYIAFNNPKLWQKLRIPCLIIGLLMLGVLYFNYRSVMGIYKPLNFNIESIVTLLLLPFLSLLKSTKVRFIDASFIFVSIISYSMYLLNHSPIQSYLMSFIKMKMGTFDGPKEQFFILDTLMFWSFTFIFSYLLYRFFENPMTNLRDKFSSSDS